MKVNNPMTDTADTGKDLENHEANAAEPTVDARTALTDEKFMSIVDRVLTVGGEWKVSMSIAGCTMTYNGETHAITEKQADIMFTCIPRKCVDAPTKAKEERP